MSHWIYLYISGEHKFEGEGVGEHKVKQELQCLF